MFQSSSELNWYIFYTCPRAEKIVQRELFLRHYEVFLPMTRTLRIWKNRQKKLIDQVLFPNYIFVKTYPSELYYIIRVKRIVTCINCAGKPSTISSIEVAGIKAVLETGLEVTVENKYEVGESVKIIEGPLVGYEGILVKQEGRTRFGIQLKEISQTILINIEGSMFEKI